MVVALAEHSPKRKLILSIMEISAVIVCKNEEDHIAACIESLQDLTDDIIVLDNGSTDRTKEIVAAKKAKLITGEWKGYGKTKNSAAHHTKYDWILSLDADEEIDEVLRNNLKHAQLKEGEVYKLKFKNFFGNKHLRFGEWGNDAHIRLFNKHRVFWDEEAVHEKLFLPQGTRVKRIKGAVLHHTVKDIDDYSQKMLRYALLNAEKYAARGKKSSAFKIFLAPRLSFAKYYFLKLGFLDGWAGLVCAYMTSYYSFVKYARLLELNKSKNQNS
jgi:glycosyltransferase involved in cell wall biosynthesis